jgi:hypothetical protein
MSQNIYSVRDFRIFEAMEWLYWIHGSGAVPRGIVRAHPRGETNTMATVDPLIVSVSQCSSRPGQRVLCIHHRALPELQGEGGTPWEAAVDLLRRLTRESNSFPDAWHRSSLARVITEIRVFIMAGLLRSRIVPIA